MESLMISNHLRRGLIVAPAPRISDPLEKLIAQLDWPVLLRPSLRLLFQQIEVTSPQCLLFWLDQTHEIGDALRLIARLRDRGSRPYRIAVAHQLEQDVEPAIRAAGVHSLLCTSGNIPALVQNALLPLLNLQPQPAAADHAPVAATEPLIRGPTSVRASPAQMHPP
jgi:hypothetical protein